MDSVEEGSLMMEERDIRDVEVNRPEDGREVDQDEIVPRVPEDVPIAERGERGDPADSSLPASDQSEDEPLDRDEP